MRRALLVLLLLLGAAAALLPRPSADRLSAQAARELLALPVDPLPGAARSPDAPALWRALLRGPAATRTETGVTLRIGRVLADPSSARGAAEAAGELLRQPARNAAGELGAPLWRVVLDGPGTERRDGAPVFKIYGCRHKADPDAGPVLEDTYAARLALAQGLRELAALDPGTAGLVIEGESMPVRGGANFELSLSGDTHSVEVTFDGHEAAPILAQRAFRPAAPNDAVARRSLVRGLRDEVGADGTFPPLTIEGEDAPAAGGVDFRLERIGERQALSAQVAGAPPLRVHRPWLPPRGATRWIPTLVALLAVLFLWRRRK
jgi:hypothetical protein